MAVACSRAGDSGQARELTFRALVGRAGYAVAPIAAAVMDPRLILDPVMDPVMDSVMEASRDWLVAEGCFSLMKTRSHTCHS